MADHTDRRFTERTPEEDEQLLRYFVGEMMLDGGRLRLFRRMVRDGRYSDFRPWPQDRVQPAVPTVSAEPVIA